ncbi:fimbria/pilus periplasmic chaperone [Dickeya lacustris]|uniref:Fimbria/pilus periplasmic chaperone n=2 Tax=Dickeya lacustris TaxID=2259638 RepID=A0ABY8GCM1_9GAMM|nr:fimbria/pilus periplasmic chaperone [Dickeya lacustris]WFN57579.1 fimbria/pilus periplasmic chaperone [Dickeya lacustris]
MWMAGVVLLIGIGAVAPAVAGVALGATRVIYPADQKQVQLAVNNNDANSTYLVQSWVENMNGQKDGQFVITPPLFVMQGKKENTLRIIDATNQRLAQDKESLFWINVKAIPSLDKTRQQANTLQLAIISRIKLLYRPTNLPISPSQAAAKLRFKRQGNHLLLSNPTPYFLTVTELKMGDQTLENALVPPTGQVQVPLPASASGRITYRTINDYGALTPAVMGVWE